MTIKEYKQKFIDLFRQMQDEHGECEYVKIYNDADGELFCGIDF